MKIYTMAELNKKMYSEVQERVYNDGSVNISYVSEDEYGGNRLRLRAYKGMCPPLDRYIPADSNPEAIDEHADSLYNSIRTVC